MQKLLILPLIVTSFLWSETSFSSPCTEAVNSKSAAESTDFSENPIVELLNSRLGDPDYKVIILGRHGKASQVNKFTAAERLADPAKVDLDIQRPLTNKGKKAASRLANLMSQLTFREVGMWGSHALRVKKTAEPTIEVIPGRVKIKEFDQSLYYADIPKEMHERLIRSQHDGVSHAFFWGHGKTTLALFKKLTGATEGFLPTAAIMVVALKAISWEQVFEGAPDQVEAYAWSPKKSHHASGGAPIDNLESLGFESVQSSEEPDNQGFEYNVLQSKK